MKCLALTRARAIRPGCIVGGSRCDGPRDDTPDGAVGCSRPVCCHRSRRDRFPGFYGTLPKAFPSASTGYSRPTDCSSPNLSRSNHLSRLQPSSPMAAFCRGPARQRFTLDGRGHDGSLAIPQVDAVRRDRLAAPMLSCSAAHAGQASPATHRANGKSFHPFAAFVTEASRRFSVPEHWIRAVMRVESGQKSRARSRKGAIGLMKIKPMTWTELCARHGLGADPYISANSTIVTARRGSSPPTMQGLDATNATRRQVDRCRRRHKRMWQRSCRRSRTCGPASKLLRRKVVCFGQLVTVCDLSASIAPDGKALADMRQNRSSRRYAVVDLSALIPQSNNLFVRLARGIRSQ
ncbi:transglycosylase SLT domain-containing protein [Bradyrhizobium sp. AUGA SZCCT0283]|uniref:transglycosylase SLT domain-containing protein n=1 Tax=Bradyrhizobium sp. AUGA SZCCT0283 TaxID=2807671 RepID=UPI003907F516